MSRTPSSRITVPQARPQLETLEDRLVPTITWHGGPVMPNVEVQAVYLGSDWYYSTYLNQAYYLEASLKSLVNSSFMDALTRGGYYVGRGSYDYGKILNVNLGQNTAISDDFIVNEIQDAITNHTLKTPDFNRLYVVFVQDNVEVTSGGSNSINDFLAYHSAFYGQDVYGQSMLIRYAVVPYHGGTVGNAQVRFLSTLDSMTEACSHEVAEAVTDPDVNLNPGWYDNRYGLGGEVGDITNQSVVYLNGFAVQRISDRFDNAMTPAGATSNVAVRFALSSGGNLFEFNPYSGWSFLSGGVAKISDQGIDNEGHAFIDAVAFDGNAYEYHDVTGWVYLDSNVVDAKAGQGVSYLLYNSTSVYEYDDNTGNFTYLAGGAAAIDAGTDYAGANMVVALSYGGVAYEHSDSTGWRYLGSYVSQISAGQQGVTGLLTSWGGAYIYNEASGLSYLAGGVSGLTVGTDVYGFTTITVAGSSGGLYDFDFYSGWSTIGGGVSWISKEHLGRLEAVYAGSFFEHSYGWYFLGGDTVQTA